MNPEREKSPIRMVVGLSAEKHGQIHNLERLRAIEEFFPDV
jgi:hypothetical protein